MEVAVGAEAESGDPKVWQHKPLGRFGKDTAAKVQSLPSPCSLSWPLISESAL